MEKKNENNEKKIEKEIVVMEKVIEEKNEEVIRLQIELEQKIEIINNINSENENNHKNNQILVEDLQTKVFFLENTMDKIKKKEGKSENKFRILEEEKERVQENIEDIKNENKKK